MSSNAICNITDTNAADQILKSEPGSSKQSKQRCRRNSKVNADPEDRKNEPDPELRKKRKTRSKNTVYYENDDCDEDQAAELAGFNPYEMESFEKKYFPQYLNYEAEYLIIRNHILSMWKQDPYQFLTLSKIVHDLQEEVIEDAERIYRFLTIHGAINTGCFANEKSKTEFFSSPIIRSKRVLVVGAGAAGIAATRQLLQFGYQVVVLEANTRIGGRIYTSNASNAKIDYGASIITGLVGNPLDEPFRQLKISARVIGDQGRLYWRKSGVEVPKYLDRAMDNAFNRLLAHASKLKTGSAVTDSSLGVTLDLLSKSLSSDERCVLDWFYANLEYACATDLACLSNNFWDQDDEYDFEGDHLMLIDGYYSMIEPLSRGLDIRLGEEIVAIQYSTDPARVVAYSNTSEVYEGDMAVITLPLGVLKDGRCKFEPPLPAGKCAAINRVGFGLLNKIILYFESAFWEQRVDWFGTVNEGERSGRGYAYLIWNMQKICSRPVLVALCAGKSSHTIEEMKDSEMVEELVEILRRINGLEMLPTLVDWSVTRWKSDKYARGSYSYLAMGAVPEDYDELAASVANVLFFAGEHTNRRHPATVAGAYQSGIREAARIYSMSMGDNLFGTDLVGYRAGKPTKVRRRGIPTQSLFADESTAIGQDFKYKYSYLYMNTDEEVVRSPDDALHAQIDIKEQFLSQYKQEVQQLKRSQFSPSDRWNVDGGVRRHKSSSFVWDHGTRWSKNDGRVGSYSTYEDQCENSRKKESSSSSRSFLVGNSSRHDHHRDRSSLAIRRATIIILIITITNSV